MVIENKLIMKLLEKLVKNKSVLILIVISIALFFSFIKKGSHDLQEWDEARNGVNAFEMLQNGDYINLHYKGELDTWNAKPPLLIWLIALSYKLFGFNEFALRLPTTLAVIFFFYFAFQLISGLTNPKTAFITCIVLMASKAVFGNHIGLTADFDGLLLLFLTASVYYFIDFTEHQTKYSVFLMALFTSLAFYTKGPASLVLMPGFFLYSVIRKQWWILKMWQTWVSLVIFLMMVLSWFYVSSVYGHSSSKSFYGSKSAIETMIVYDTIERLTNPAFDMTGYNGNIYLFVFEVLDARLNLWNYVFYLGVITGIVWWFKRRSAEKLIPFLNKRKMLLLSICLISPLAMVMTVASTKNNWYLAPIFLYVAYIVSETIQLYINKNKLSTFLITALFIFTFVRQTAYLVQLPSEKHKYFNQIKALKNNKIILLDEPTQDVVLYLKWLNVVTIYSKTINDKALKEGVFFVGKQTNEYLQNQIATTSISNALSEGAYQIGFIKLKP